MMVVADASPLIFLAKIRRLNLIARLFGHTIIIPDSVAAEVLRPPLPPDEERLLQEFIDSIQIESVSVSRKNSSALSRADMAVCQLALKRKAGLVLTDDKLLRALLVAENLKPLGTLGILIHAVEKELIKKTDAKTDLETLVKKHGFRISIELFERVLERLGVI